MMISNAESKPNDRQRDKAEVLSAGGLSHRVLAWVYFCSSLKQPGWQQRAAGLGVDRAPIEQWLAAGAIGRKVRVVSFLLLLLGGLLGIGGMVGALSYSGGTPVNLWLMLGLFCILPLLMTLSSVFTVLRLSAQHSPFLVELLAGAIHKTGIGINASQLLSSTAGRLWLFRQVQWLGIVFQTALIVTFMLVLLFNDVAFGWSSTLIKQSQWLPAFFNVFTWPWHNFMDGPSEMLISQSQFYRAGSSLTVVDNPALRGEWWPHIALGMCVYGLVPRWILFGWLSYKVGSALQREMTYGGELDQFFLACSSGGTIAPKMPPSIQGKPIDDNFVLPTLTLGGEWVVSWQRDFTSPPSGVLGLKKWRDDECWLRVNAVNWAGIVYFLVHEEQVPTAEIADVFDLMDDINGGLNIHIVVLVKAFENEFSERQRHQCESWRYFAIEQKRDIVFVAAIERAEGGR